MKASIFALWLAAIVFGLLTVESDGFPDRFDQRERVILQMMERTEHYGMYQRTTCFLDQTQPHAEYDEKECIDQELENSILIIGDSFAAHFYPGLAFHAEGNGFSVSQATKASCSPALPVSSSCKDFLAYLMEDLIPRVKPAIIVYSEYWQRNQNNPDFPEQIRSFILSLGEFDSTIIISGATPRFPGSVPKAVVDKGLAFESNVELVCRDNTPVRETLVGATLDSSATLVDYQSMYFAPSENKELHFCRAAGENGVFHWDWGHLTQAGSVYYSEFLWSEIEIALRAGR